MDTVCWRDMISFLRRHHRKIQEIGTGLVLWEGFNFLFDFTFYPFALAYWGLVKGGIIAVILCLIINAFVFWLYEHMRVDWLGAHALRELEAEENKSHFEKIITWLGKKKKHRWEKLADPIIFSILLIPVDPVIVAIHYQRLHFEGLEMRDWSILIVATLVANLWWLIQIGAVVAAFEFLAHLVV